MDISAEIKGVKYKPFLCKRLNTFEFTRIEIAFSSETTFILSIDESHRIAVSWWVSPKRTRSYPYARIYNSLDFSGKRVTVIPFMKDEGADGDRDFITWDTIALMSLLGIYVIISYYANATKNPNYNNKITEQQFNFRHIRKQIKELLIYQSDALHWNLSQIDKIGAVARNALKSYKSISNKLNIGMHSKELAQKRINQLLKGKDNFMTLSRKLAKRAQERESVTIQPKEKLAGEKATLTIKNYLGGYYYLTCDEAMIHGQDVYLTEAKHTRKTSLPSSDDIKDGLLKMILFTNLENVRIGCDNYNPVPILKLTTGSGFNLNSISYSENEMLKSLKKEAKMNGFKIEINDSFYNAE